ncbi:uncharacterized protein LOC123396664 isoform X2 [Hordeum vulgare subsp. vulgare]|uniref:uncharacterized protein LOC123396664 isoform X2 n=1 Tax=Hordeum vulgare subsp. vulgare TaxID=112509 RepID=UPI001D1A3791|nr:uncharacterized protein LOC123396664 isoform X2 [Hordeum vulgare subsp. vulgare]XP_044947469.1 uncharacterized protein LOC123396664 isoform X2 [Hordeum vulgare subsp. vulgare]
MCTLQWICQPGRTAVHQVAPLGVPPVARGSYEKAMNMMGMQYEQYDTAEKESSLVCKYAADDVVVHVMGWVRQWWAMAPMVRQRKTRNVKTCGASVCLGDSVGSRPPLSRSPWGPEASQGHRPWCSSSRLDAFYRKKWFIF